MEKKEHLIIIIVLTTAVVLLLLLYSPWGSPDNYKTYSTNIQGVNFCNKVIGCLNSQVGSINGRVGAINSVVNAPKDGSVADYENSAFNIADNYSLRQSARRVTAVNYPAINVRSNAIISNYRMATSSSSSRRNDGEVNPEMAMNMGGGGGQAPAGEYSTFLANSNRFSSVRGSASVVGGISTTSVDLTMLNDSTTLFGSDSPQKSDSDPGDNPTEPVPVPEGWGFMLALALFYLAYKQKLFLRFFDKKSVF